MFGRDSLRLTLALSRRTLARWHQSHATSVHTSRCITSMGASDTTTQDGRSPTRAPMREGRGHTWRSAVSRLCPIETGCHVHTRHSASRHAPISLCAPKTAQYSHTRAQRLAPCPKYAGCVSAVRGLAVGTGQFSWSCFLQFVPLRPPTLIARASAQRRAPRRGPASSQTSPRSSPRRPADQT